MRNSTPSKNHFSPPSIKAQHRCAKKKAIRRKRIDLKCGCSYYMHINCANHGFTHRGEHHCNSSTEWRIYLGDKKSPIFQDPRASQETVQQQQRHFDCPDQIQPQLKEGTGDSQMFFDLQNLDDLTASDWSFLKDI
ncbi:transcription activator protein [Rhynchosia yellow mosaic India virus]|uniref:Transcriptional activator protein n=1 Tax=Rhynchosia yellow mosaic India virus TaxID=935473 RepID=E7CWL4_9GEMI|nr:transcription activator protein [Rhynchosia yellow mosaic India virus]ADU02159.1 transcription activator protein [Rhynchosia yellow mosaic India virus]ADU02165.1 transcription activator protein [Rhynchosia yellow mosaic India virus]